LEDFGIDWPVPGFPLPNSAVLTPQIFKLPSRAQQRTHFRVGQLVGNKDSFKVRNKPA
jgi:hypothetical protein